MNSPTVKNTSERSSSKRIVPRLFLLLAILTIMILIVLPKLANWALDFGIAPEFLNRFLSLLSLAQNLLIQILCAAWIFFLGGCFASFLNVVAWRVPRGGSITGSSHCPDCQQRLPFRDNLPVIGWLGNGGRCSNCQLRIPVRYLLVEIFLGALFLLITAVQVLSGGSNLPLRQIGRLKGFENLILFPQLDLICLTVFHLILICLLFTFTIIKSETLKIPRKVWLVGLVFGLLLPLIWPSLTLVGWEFGQREFKTMARGSSSQLLTLGLGLVTGTALGLLLQYWRPAPEPEHPYVFQGTYIGEEVAALSLIGLFLGWQSALSVFLFAVPLILVAFLSRLKWKLFSPSGCIFFATLIHLFCWRLSTSCHYWPSGRSDWLGWIF